MEYTAVVFISVTRIIIFTLTQILFLGGVIFIIGFERTYRFFFQAHKLKGSVFFFGGILLVLIGWPIIGMLVECYGSFLLFGLAHTHACTHTHVHTLMHTHSRTHTHTHSHACTHTYAHTQRVIASCCVVPKKSSINRSLAKSPWNKNGEPWHCYHTSTLAVVLIVWSTKGALCLERHDPWTQAKIYYLFISIIPGCRQIGRRLSITGLGSQREFLE